MSNIAQRLLLFFLGIPLIAALILLFPQVHHAATVAAIFVFCGGCAVELSRLFEARGIPARPITFAALGAGIPACTFVGGLVLGEAQGRDFLSGSLAGMILGLAFALLALFARFAFTRADDIHKVIPRSSALAFSAIYPGLFGSAIALIAAEPRYGTESILSFCILAFSNDSLAWLIGMTLGRRRGLVAVSPNKSLAGFVGGMLGSIGSAFGCAALFPEAIEGPWWEILAFGLVIGAVVIIGDLFESALKRSASIKDSGNAVPGRGGFLDSFDSLLFTAPVFFGLSLILGYFR